MIFFPQGPSALFYIVLGACFVAPPFLFEWLGRLMADRQQARQRFRQHWLRSSVLMLLLVVPSLIAFGILIWLGWF